MQHIKILRHLLPLEVTITQNPYSDKTYLKEQLSIYAPTF
jgi:hypothetical protein